MHNCPFCGLSFDLISDLRGHIFKNHKSDNIKCPFCNFIGETWSDFAIHLLITKEENHDNLLQILLSNSNRNWEKRNKSETKNVENNNLLISNNQQLQSQNENENIKDNNSEIENKENVQNINQIQIEDNKVQEIDNQKMKIKKRKPKRKLKCPYCGYEVVWYRNLKHHISLFHKMNIIEKNKNEENEVNQNSEEKNNQQLQSQNENENIKDNNSETENFDFNKCPYCGQEFIRINELRYHIKNIHLLNNYNCPFCKIEFEVPLLLLIHLWNFNDKKHRYLHGLITKG